MRFSRLILGQSLQSNIVSVEVGIHGMIHVGDIVLHAESKEKNSIRYLHELEMSCCSTQRNLKILMRLFFGQ